MVKRNRIFQYIVSVARYSSTRQVSGAVAAFLIISIAAGCGASSFGSSTDSGNNSANKTVSGGGSGSAANPIKGLPPVSFKQNPKEITFDGCPSQGDGGDPVLNNNKNRVDAGNFQPVVFDTIEKLPWPPATERKSHAEWSAADQAQVAQAEGLPVQVEGYLAEARQEGPETPNCHSTTDLDFHIWMIRAPGGAADRTEAIVIEATPRVRANHPGWTVTALNKIAKSGTKIRVSGWLMLDPEHPDQVGKTRGTIWEVHPIIELEVAQNGQWVKLDNSR